MKKILLFSLLAGLLNSAKAQDGQLDSSFGKAGITITDIGVRDKGINYDTYGSQVLLNPDGSMYFISGSLTLDYLYISKKDKDGNLDMIYGKNGFAVPIPIAAGYGAHAVLQKDGKIIIAGFSRYTDTYYSLYSVVYRLNTDGSLDNTFNGKGLKVFKLYTTETTVAIQKDGKIIVGGSALVDNKNRYLLYRLNTDGSEDKTFTKVGKLTDSVISYKSLAIQEDGKIIASGYKTDTSGKNVFIINRYNSDGSIDVNFKSTGIPDAYTSANGLPPGAFSTYRRNMANLIDANGNILVAGTVKNNFGIARFKQDGSFDTLVTVNFTGSDNFFLSAAIGSDGKIILFGGTAIASLNQDLSLNTNFSDDGKLLIADEGFLLGISSIAIQKDGKIVQLGSITGTGGSYYPNIAAARLNSNGSVDEQFGNMGKLYEVLVQTSTNFLSAAVQQDGKIVAGGYAFNGTTFHFALARYKTNGDLDSSFAGNGKVMTELPNKIFENYIQSIAIQSDGKIIAGGFSQRGPSLVRYNSNGTVEHNYGPDGYPDNINSIAIQKDGRFIVASPTGLTRYTNFEVDTTFNRGRFLIYPTINNHEISGKQIALQKDEKIIVLGTSSEYPPYPVVFRYNVNGKLDSTFGINGIAFNSLKEGYDAANSICVQTDDKILIGGDFQDINNIATHNFSISRLNKNGSRDSTFNKGEIVHSFTEGLDVGNTIKLQKDGKIIIAGNSVVDGQKLFKIARFNSDGSVDKTFNNTGSITTYPNGAFANIASIAIQGNNLYAVGSAFYPSTSGVIAKYRLCNAPEVLPMKIIFDGQLKSNKIALKWQVQNPQQLKYFTVEKSGDSIHFSLIKNIAAINTVTSAYSTVDNTPYPGTNFYRLKLKNADSTVTYSQLIKVNLLNSNTGFKIFPNPVKNMLMITSDGVGEMTTLQFFDNTGMKRKEIIATLNADNNINISGLPAGIYNLKISTKADTHIIKFIKE